MRHYSLLLILLFFVSITTLGQEYQTIKKLDYLVNADPEKGEALFVANCNKCHMICNQNLGPSLTNVAHKRPLPWLVSFIQNSTKMIDSGDPYAVHLYESYNRMEMPLYQELSETDIKNILAYIERESNPTKKDTVVAVTLEVSALIKNAMSNVGSKQKGEIDYYAKKSGEVIPVEDGTAVLRGKGLFNAQCNVCHEICQSKIGPALASVTQRRPLSWLLSFIKNPTEMVKSGDDYSNFLVTNYTFIMPNFSYLSTADKLDILAYIRHTSSAGDSRVGVNSQNIDSGDPNPINADSLNLTNYDSLERVGAIRAPGQGDADGSFSKIATILIAALVLVIVAFFSIRFYKRKKRGKHE